MQIRLSFLVLVIICPWAHADTVFRTESGNTFTMTFANGKKTISRPDQTSISSLFQRQLVLEDYLFLEFNLRTFCNPLADEDGDKEAQMCIKAYNDLIDFQDRGLVLSSLPDIYIAPDDLVAPNQVSSLDPYSDIFGFVWIDGRNPLNFEKLQSRIDERAAFLSETRRAIGEFSQSLDYSISLECDVESTDCLQGTKMLRTLDSKPLERVRAARAWLKGFRIVPAAKVKIALNFRNSFSERVISIPSNVKARELEMFINENIH